jgi:hypothetical protein
VPSNLERAALVNDGTQGSFICSFNRNQGASLAVLIPAKCQFNDIKRPSVVEASDTAER